MRWPWHKSEEPSVAVAGDPEGVRRARDILEASRRRHAAAVREEIVPLRRIREQNNVTAMARHLLGRGGNSGSESSAH
jgi:hypothetical protein